MAAMSLVAGSSSSGSAAAADRIASLFDEAASAALDATAAMR
jgi:hypothetical protein